jgi:uncharacterized membrane protein
VLDWLPFDLPFNLGFAPHLPSWAMIACVVLAAVVFIYTLWRRGTGAFARLLALAVMILALANPLIVTETREGLDDVVALVVDRTQSQDLGTRLADTERTLNAFREQLGQMDNLEVREIEVRTDAERGTALFSGLNAVVGQIPVDRFAGAIMITDGQVHDPPDLETFNPGAPIHVVLTGERDERDRKLSIVRASRFSIVGEEAEITVLVEDIGLDGATSANMTMSVDGEDPESLTVPVGEEYTFSLPVEHGGENVIELEVEAGDEEQTLQNNAAVVVVNGVRDRLRVLLVSGQPHAGERVWRDLLKSDPSVDLVHFTILRSPNKIEFTPINELSLIVFPQRELFVEKLDEFDLVVLDRYVNDERVVPLLYLENIARYVENGGALMLSSGPELAQFETSIYATPLASVLPARPIGEVIDGGFTPHVTNQGLAHPVTGSLEGSNREAVDGEEASQAEWGRWFRVIASERVSGVTAMDAPNGMPLLVLDRVGEGRVAQLLSDQVWLWARGFEDGGPQAELLRRLAHWLMKEPDLEEERLLAEVQDGELRITRRTMATEAADVSVTAPDGSESTVALTRVSPGVFTGRLNAERLGLYHLNDGEMNAVAAAGPLNPREIADMRATEEIVEPYVEASGGGIEWISDGVPELREVGEGANASGNGWLGVERRGSYRVTAVENDELLPPWLALFLVIGTTLFAWRRESR